MYLGRQADPHREWVLICILLEVGHLATEWEDVCGLIDLVQSVFKAGESA
jgi:hypothetical protein